MQPIRVLIIDDSAFMRKMLRDILESDPRIHVIGTARDGVDGLQKIQEMKPDVVTMDINMPKLDGITALKEIMRKYPLPVIMLSSEVGDSSRDAIKAIEYGAIDLIPKPSGAISLDIETIKEEIIAKVIAASGAALPLLKTEERSMQGERSNLNIRRKRNKDTLIAIGTSTGGPRALQRVLTDLPEHFSLPILIVQHMPPVFTRSLAERLDSLTPLHVKEAEHGEIIRKETVYIAPGGYHMLVERTGTSYAIKLSKEEPINNHRPSVDALFQSISKLQTVNKVAVVLTGMGADGSEGIREIRRMDKDALIIAESENTSVIYGMPKAASMTGDVNDVLPLDQIGHFLGSIT